MFVVPVVIIIVIVIEPPTAATIVIMIVAVPGIAGSLRRNAGRRQGGCGCEDIVPGIGARQAQADGGDRPGADVRTREVRGSDCQAHDVAGDHPRRRRAANRGSRGAVEHLVSEIIEVIRACRPSRHGGRRWDLPGCDRKATIERARGDSQLGARQFCVRDQNRVASSEPAGCRFPRRHRPQV